MGHELLSSTQAYTMSPRSAAGPLWTDWPTTNSIATATKFGVKPRRF